jgi:integrase
MARRANDEGSIWKRRDGRYSGAYFVPTPGGGRVRRYVYGSSRDEVHEKLVDLMVRVQRGLPVPSTRETVSGYLRGWLEEVAAKRVRTNTLTGYRINIERHIIPRIGRRKLAKLTARDVRLMLEDCRKAGLSEGSVRYLHGTLRVALEDAMREDLVSRNVAKLVRLSMPDRPETRVLSATEGKRLLRATMDDRLAAALVLLVLLGLRRSELLGLRWQDVDLERRVLRVRQGLHYLQGELRFLPPKTRRSRRTVPLPDLCVEALREHREHQDEEQAASLHPWPDTGLVFVTSVGTPIDPNNFSRTFARWSKEASLPVVRLHDLRHTPVSRCCSRWECTLVS